MFQANDLTTNIGCEGERFLSAGKSGNAAQYDAPRLTVQISGFARELNALSPFSAAKFHRPAGIDNDVAEAKARRDSCSTRSHEPPKKNHRRP